MFSGEFGMLYVVIFMLLCMVFVTSLLKKYQAHKANLRAKVKHFESGISFIESAMEQLQKIPVPPDLTQLLQQDLYDRYEGLQKVFPSYPEIDRKMREAKLRLQSENKMQVEELPVPETENELGDYTKAMDEIVHYLQHIRPIKQRVLKEAVDRYTTGLGEQRAEIIARYLLVLAARSESAGNREEAKAYLNRLMTILRKRGPNTDFVRSLYDEADNQLQEYYRSGSGAADSK